MAALALTEPWDVSGYTPSLKPKDYTKTQESFLRLLDDVHVEERRHIVNDAITGDNAVPLLVYTLNADEIAEIDQAVHHFEGCALPLPSISPENFPLKSLGAKIRGWIKVLRDEEGAVLLRGIDPFRYTATQNVAIHAGLTSYVGRKRAMLGALAGDTSVLQHVTELPPPKGGSYHGPPNQTRSIPFHTDNGDIVSLYTVSPSHTGGTFYLADIDPVWKKLTEVRPDLAKVLEEDWTYISPSPMTAPPVRPLVFHANGHVYINCARATITGTASRPRPMSLPALTPVQREALDTLHHISQEVAYPITFASGDLLLFNNLRKLHARDRYTDDASRGHHRHLLRLIVQDEGRPWALPEPWRSVWQGYHQHDVAQETMSVRPEWFSASIGH